LNLIQSEESLSKVVPESILSEVPDKLQNDLLTRKDPTLQNPDAPQGNKGDLLEEYSPKALNW